jgi:hypothetical protein
LLGKKSSLLPEFRLTLSSSDSETTGILATGKPSPCGTGIDKDTVEYTVCLQSSAFLLLVISTMKK